MPQLQLAYLDFEVRKPAEWERFLRTMLGLPEPTLHADGSQGWRIDAAAHRLIVREGRADDLTAIGFECADARHLQALVDRLRQAGHGVDACAPGHAQARRVAQLWRTQDPQGNTVELCLALAQSPQPFTSAMFPAGFCTGALGLGHAVLVTQQLAAMEQFYGQVLGFGVTERLKTKVGPIEIEGTFLHCNRRHHSLALFDMPLAKRMHHFMLQAHALGDVGRAYERARQMGVPLSLDLGQHPEPDGTFSFYGETPSGFDFEIGAGTHDIEPQGWHTMHTSTTSSWGHQPRLRVKLKMARGWLANGFGRRKKKQEHV